MSLTRRRNEGIAIAHKWEMWNVVDATRYRDKSMGVETTSYSMGRSITYGASYSFDVVTGLYTLNNRQTIVLDSDNANDVYRQYIGGSGTTNGVQFVTRVSISSNRVNYTGTYRQSQAYTTQVKGDTFKGYVYGEDGAYPDNNYVGDTWYVQVY